FGSLPVPDLLIGGRCLYRRTVIVRPHRASNELKHCDCQESLQPDHLSGILLHLHFSKLLHLESPGNVARTIWTSCPETMESGGLTMTWSSALRPATISIVLPKSWPGVTAASTTFPSLTMPTRKPSARNIRVLTGITKVEACVGMAR